TMRACPCDTSQPATPDSWADASNRFDSGNVNHNWVLGKNKLNELVVQYTNYRDSILARSTAPNITFPNAGGITTGGNLAAPQRTEQIKYQLRDDFSWHITGHGGLGHDLKTGINFVDEPRLFISSESGNGVVAYTMLGSSLSGPVTLVTRNGGFASANLPNKQYGFYVQDDWRASDR